MKFGNIVCVCVSSCHIVFLIPCRLYELVSGKHVEKRDEEGAEGLRYAHRQVKEENTSLTVQSEGETVKNKKSEWKERGDEGRRERVMCLSALVPVLAAYHTLYPMALSGQ